MGVLDGYDREFRLTDEHVRLVRALRVRFDDSAYDGAPGADVKRPYGNSDVLGDIASVLGVEPDLDPDGDGAEDRYSEGLVERLWRLHRETGVALQVVLATADFRPGLYRRRKYDSLGWERSGD